MRDYSTIRRMPNHTLLKIVLLTVVVLVLSGSAVLLYVYSKINNPLTSQSSEKVFEVEKGSTLTLVAEQLEKEGLISSAFIFRLYAFVTSPTANIQAGNFVLNSNMTPAEIFADLTKGKGLASETRVTFLEGDTLEEYAVRVGNSKLISSQQFLDAAARYPVEKFGFLSDKPITAGLEGYLFPDTYDFKKNSTADQIIEKMLANFDRKLTEQMRDDIARQGKSIFEIITMASIVEKEVGRNLKTGTKLSEEDLQKLREERRLVAGVFYNRLSIGMALESDATLAYVTGSNSSRSTYEELAIDSPYNTYKNRGLPPSPISNPSLDAILAAIYPADTDYMYFLSSAEGTAYFAKTFEGHQENRARYLE